jgi:hypothetical protein
MIKNEQVGTLIDHAARLGLNVPPVVERLLRSPDDLSASLPTCYAWYFDLGESLTKVDLRKTTADEHEYGYIVSFYSDQQGCGYLNLYFDVHGGFGVVSSDGRYPTWNDARGEEDTIADNTDGGEPELTELEIGLGVRTLGRRQLTDLCLEGVDFEKWLFRHVDGEAAEMRELELDD